MVVNIIRYVAGVLLGFLAFSLVDLSIRTLFMKMIPLPAGVDPGNIESLAAGMKLFEAKHFVGIFLGHSIGTLVSAFVAAAIVPRHKSKFALALGVLGLLGGIAGVFLLSPPLWYDVVDLVFAYIPMAWIAAKIAGALTTEKTA